ncbi:hypothetical protein [Roseobacter sinensis]|uniref:Uncharacterized protein n=1 Tax=Roseobacter sinensis TaxID=2931391 RepID=A0ABT3BLC9_9RHOB|nr:hypothetical protein [Roseobacter sp. WL0113]MCV3274384.1 hypothetical protein [Roseobacter sp. WL0113]
MVRKTLVMWSGGLDSTYGLVNLLRETDDDVFAHHISRHARSDSGHNSTRTADYENDAVARMLPLISETYRPFSFGQSTVDLRAFRSFARDTSTAMFLAAHAARSHGFSRDDRILLSMNSDEDKSWNPGSELYRFLRAYTVRILRLTWGAEDFPTCFLWDPPPRKQKEANYLPKHLFDMTASCREPRYDPDGEGYLRCQICPECVTLSSVVHREANDVS